MSNQVAMVNRALSRIGTRSTITAITEDTNEAYQASLWWEPTRRQVIQAAFWNFAKRVENGALLKAAPGTPENPTTSAATWSSAFPPPPWLYSYAYPVDGIQIRYVTPQWNVGAVSPPISVSSGYTLPDLYYGAYFPFMKFEVGQDVDDDGNAIKVIQTNAPQAIITYTIDCDDPGIFDDQFEQAFILALAANLAIALTGSKDLYAINAKEANNMMMEARASDGNEGLTISNVLPDWLRIRGVRSPNEYTGWSPSYGPLMSIF